MPILNWIGKEAVEKHVTEIPTHLLRCDHDLSHGDPAFDISPGTGNLIVEGDNLLALKALLPYYKNQVKCIYIDPPYNTGNEGWSYSAQDDWRSSSDLALWLDKYVPHRDIPRAAMKVWLSKMCADLCARVPLRELEINRMRLRRVVVQKVNAIRLQEKQQTQQQLFSELKVDGWGDAIFSENVAWELPDVYAPNELYPAPHSFKKHAFDGIIGAMNGEEIACAWELEDAPNVKYWFRNIERLPGSFWLPTTTDKFYPDFVAQLNDGRNLILEYKGGHLISGKDTEEKAAIGDLWAKLSGGKGAFLLVGQKECRSQILAV
ncbi:hypothetical protein IAD21_04891 [Abditibacteriota bacterium]|nr:hypothetical protein IAD21_04891 [Abditibacteriota bacterium]